MTAVHPSCTAAPPDAPDSTAPGLGRRGGSATATCSSASAVTPRLSVATALNVWCSLGSGSHGCGSDGSRPQFTPMLQRSLTSTGCSSPTATVKGGAPPEMFQFSSAKDVSMHPVPAIHSCSVSGSTSPISESSAGSGALPQKSTASAAIAVAAANQGVRRGSSALRRARVNPINAGTAVRRMSVPAQLPMLGRRAGA